MGFQSGLQPQIQLFICIAVQTRPSSIEKISGRIGLLGARNVSISSHVKLPESTLDLKALVEVESVALFNQFRR